MTPVLRLLVLLLLAVPLLGGAARAAGEASADRTLSPYFFVASEDSTVDPLPLKSTSAEVHIAGVIADVRVAQVYRNAGRRPIEATYVFPASTRAAVYAMKMTIGERVIEAKIDRREEARRRYEEARSEGRRASLLEQQRPNVFQMHVANIQPGDEVKVDLRYTETLVPADRVYAFVYPTVVGPRYSNQPTAFAPAGEQWVANPYLHAGEAPSYAFDITVSLDAGLPVRDLTCISHKVLASYDGSSAVTVKLDPMEQSGGNRDYVLRYRLAGDRIESGLLLYEDEQEKFFLLMLEPPKRIASVTIPPREYIYIVDVSGSMHGFPLETSKMLLRDLLGSLRPTDRFNVLLFAGDSSVMSARSVTASLENIRRAVQLIDRQRGGGGTELLPALRRALALPRAEGFSRTVVIATDGYVHVEEEAFDVIRSGLGEANVFAFGIGSAVNRHLIEGMARAGMGEPFVITAPDKAPAEAKRFRKIVESPVLTGIRVDFRGFETYDVEPASIPDVMAERPVLVFGKWRGDARGRIAVSGLSGDGAYRQTVDVDVVKSSRNTAALRYLWARQRIAILSDYNALRRDDGRVKAVTDLGLKYSLLTAYTSFVAVDTRAPDRTGEYTTVRQPLPLSEGVSDHAVGAAGSAGALGPAALMRAVPVPSSPPPIREEAPADRRVKADPETLRITIRRANVPDGLSEEGVLGEVRRQIAAMRSCQAGEGEVTLDLTIGKDGRVKGLTVRSATPNRRAAAACIAAQLRKARFPAPSGSGEAKVTLTLAFAT